MFKAKKLNKLVAAGIITQTQKQQILEYDDNADSLALVSRALMLLGIFTVGLGIISLVASNWQDIGRTAKLATMLALLAGTGSLAWHWQSQGKRAAAEKMLLGEFFLVGAGIGLIIQVFQLSGGKIYDPWLSGVWLPHRFCLLRGKSWFLIFGYRCFWFGELFMSATMLWILFGILKS